MDIKLKAKLTAYSRVEAFDISEDHSCNMAPISKESIDKLFREDSPDTGNLQVPTTGKSFIDSLF